MSTWGMIVKADTKQLDDTNDEQNGDNGTNAQGEEGGGGPMDRHEEHQDNNIGPHNVGQKHVHRNTDDDEDALHW